LCALVALALLGAACGGSSNGSSSQSSSSTVKEGGTLRIGTSSTIDSLNPFVAFQANAILLFYYEYPYLTQLDAKNNIVPQFAKTWTVSPDGLTVTYHLTPNAKWSDGQPLNATDVAWTFNTIIKFQKGPTAYYSTYLTDLKSAEATDPNTVVFHYSQAQANSVSQLSAIPVLPEHVWSKYAAGDGKGLRTYQNAPTASQPVVSGGPFELVKYQKDEIALMQRNPSYWGPKPHIDAFGLQIYSDDDAMITALKNGELDAVEGIPTTDVKTVQAAGFKLNTTPGMFFYDFIINSNPKKPQNTELLNPQVKEAFEYAIDREQIIKVVLGGYGTPGSTIIPPADGKWHDPSIKPLPFDVAKANSILDSLGYTKGSNGYRTANGHEMSYSIIIPTSRQADLTRTFQILQPDFQQIGVKLSLKVLDPNAAFAAITAPNNQYLNFDLAMWDWIPGVDPADILSVLTKDQWGSNSDTGYNNPQYDALYNEQQAEINPQKRLQIVYQMQQMLFNDRPYIVLNYPDIIDAYNAKAWAGFYSEDGYGIFLNNGIQSLTQVHQI
jgi:peptide/nickel transport system substrate-binding protein